MYLLKTHTLSLIYFNLNTNQSCFTVIHLATIFSFNVFHCCVPYNKYSILMSLPVITEDVLPTDFLLYSKTHICIHRFHKFIFSYG